MFFLFGGFSLCCLFCLFVILTWEGEEVWLFFIYKFCFFCFLFFFKYLFWPYLLNGLLGPFRGY